MSAAAQLCFSVKDLLVDSNELNQMAPIQFLQEESEGLSSGNRLISLMVW